jgi:hypothetical protein
MCPVKKSPEDDVQFGHLLQFQYVTYKRQMRCLVPHTSALQLSLAALDTANLRKITAKQKCTYNKTKYIQKLDEN